MRMTEEELFDTMAWHVDEVTNDRISLDYFHRGKVQKFGDN